MNAYTSQLDDLISNSADTIESAYEDIEEMYESDNLQDLDLAKYKMLCTQIHQTHLKRISDFTTQWGVIAKFAPDLGEHIKKNIANLEHATSNCIDMIKHAPLKDSDGFPTDKWFVDFQVLLLDMQQTSDNIENMFNVALDVAESTLKFIEEK